MKTVNSIALQSITTKYHGATNTRGGRVTATASGGHKITLQWAYELNVQDNHKSAAHALCRKLDWPNELAMGATSQGYVFVLLP